MVPLEVDPIFYVDYYGGYNQNQGKYNDGLDPLCRILFTSSLYNCKFLLNSDIGGRLKIVLKTHPSMCYVF